MPYLDVEAHRENLRRWRAANPERHRANVRRAYESLRADPVRMARKKANDAIRERTSRKLKETRRRYKLAHPELFRKIARKQRELKPWGYLWLAARDRCTKSGVEFAITKEWAKSQWTGFCALTGMPFVFTEMKTTAFSPSLDRIDSTKGYTPDNCRFVLWGINRFRGDGTDAEMLTIAKAIVERFSAPTS